MQQRKRLRFMAMLLAVSLLVGNFYGVQFVDARETQRIFEGDGYQIVVVEQNSWDTGSVQEATVRNTGSGSLKNWTVTAEYTEGRVVNAWNVDMSEEKGSLQFECRNFNRTILPGEETTFGVQMDGASLEALKDVKLTQKTAKKAEGGYEVSYQIRDSWDGHAVIDAQIHNQTDEVMADWQLCFGFSGTITNLWNGKIISASDGNYRIGNMGYNAEIPAGGTVSFGFEAEFADGEITVPEGGELEHAGKLAQTAEPAESAVPETDTPPVEEEFDPEEDVYVYKDVENKDWNMEMIHADADIVAEQKKNPQGPIRIALLDSGVNYSDEVFVHARKNFVPGQDDYSALFEDVSGHGTAVAEIIASDPNGVPVAEMEAEEDDVYEYYGEPETTDEEKEEDGETEEDDTGSLMDFFESGYEWNEGVNPSVDLISGKVLDENNETTVERVVQAIDWAVENQSNIINMSFGMKEDSEKLHEAVKRAADQGVLLIAAAGNGEEIEYPAAYPEVMAVGSVDSMGEQAEESAEGSQMEVAAPGEFIISRGWFDSMQIFSGSSMAVPHVSGLASLLWQKDTSKSAQFIRQLIDSTARECGPEEKYGCGVIDCEYALQQYDAFETVYEENRLERRACAASVAPVLEEAVENTGEVEAYPDVRKLYGSWTGETHKSFVNKNAEQSGIGKKCKKVLDTLRTGTTFVDDEDNNKLCQGMRENPWLHGFMDQGKKGEAKKKSNYIAAYQYLMVLAEGMNRDGVIKTANRSSEAFKKYEALRNAYDGIDEEFQEDELVGSQEWGNIAPSCRQKKDGEIPNMYRSLLIFGMALHTATDAYAHSSYTCDPEVYNGKKHKRKVVWKRITHAEKASTPGIKGVAEADSTAVLARRYTNAKQIAKKIMSKIQYKDEKLIYKKNFSSPASLCAKGNLEVEKNISGKGKTKILKPSYIKQAFGMGRMYDYLNEVEELNGTVYKKARQRIEKIALGKIQSKTRGMICQRGKVKTKAKKARKAMSAAPGKTTFSVIDQSTGMKVVSETVSGDEFCFFISEDSECRVTMSNKTIKSQTCCRIDRGKVTGKNIEEIEDEDPETDPQEDPVELCGVHCFSFEPQKEAFRIELSWTKKGLDLDSILTGVFPDTEGLFMCTFVEKTAHPELADIFQKDDGRASLDHDVKDAGTETTVLHQVEPGGYYFFSVRNAREDNHLYLAQSGATIKVYREGDTEPMYTATVPKQGKGYYWNAFCIFGETGEILPINSVTDEISLF